MSYTFKKVNADRVYRPWKKWSEGDVVVGRYIEEGEDSFGNPRYDVEVLSCEFENDSEAIEAGKVLGVNSCGSLNYAMEKVDIKSIVQITYDGTDTLDKGKFEGKEFHKVSIAVDDPESFDASNEVEL